MAGGILEGDRIDLSRLKCSLKDVAACAPCDSSCPVTCASLRRRELAPSTRDGEMNRVNITLRQKVQSRRGA
jgi:hypothetical protein